MPQTGAISMGDTNTELISTLTNDTATTQRSFNDTKVRALFSRSSGEISMSNGYGKSRAVIAVSKVITVAQSGLLVRVQNIYHGGGIPPRIFALGTGSHPNGGGSFAVLCGGVNGNAAWHYETNMAPYVGAEMQWNASELFDQNQGRTQELYTISASEYIIYDNITNSTTFLGSQNMGANQPEWYPSAGKNIRSDGYPVLANRRDIIVSIISDITSRVSTGSTITFA